MSLHATLLYTKGVEKPMSDLVHFNLNDMCMGHAQVKAKTNKIYPNKDSNRKNILVDKTPEKKPSSSKIQPKNERENVCLALINFLFGIIHLMFSLRLLMDRKIQSFFFVFFLIQGYIQSQSSNGTLVTCINLTRRFGCSLFAFIKLDSKKKRQQFIRL